MAIAEIDVTGAAGEDVPVVVCIAREHEQRMRLVRLLRDEAIVVMAPDARTAWLLLEGGHAPLSSPTAAATDVVSGRGAIDGLDVDRSRHEVRWRGVPLPLTRREREIVACLAQDPGRVWTYEELHVAAWKSRWLDDATAVHAAVKRLRAKLRLRRVPLVVDVVRGVGFRLIAASDT